LSNWGRVTRPDNVKRSEKREERREKREERREKREERREKREERRRVISQPKPNEGWVC